MVKLGLVIGDLMPRPLARPRTKVVLPAPTSPISSMTIASVGSALLSFSEDDDLLGKSLSGASPADAVCV